MGDDTKRPGTQWGTELDLGAHPDPRDDAPERITRISRIDLSAEHLAILPREVAEHFLVAPLRVDDDEIEIAMADTTQDKVVEELEFTTGKHVIRVEASPEEVKDALDRAYAAIDEGVRLADAPRRRPTSQAFMKAVVRPDRS